MNAAATSGEEETAVKKGDGENGRHSMVGADHVAATTTQTLTDSDEKSAEVTAPGMTATTSADDSGSSSQATTQPAGAEESVSDELPRKRRGILLGTHPGPATPDAVDDGKSLSWMATQAVKAVNAVKASQLEQAQAWKAGAGMPEDEQSGQAEEDSAAIDARESVAMEWQAPVQPPPGGAPAMTEAMPPVESSQEAATTPRIPPGARAAAPRVPARMALMLGVLMMFSYAGYRYWFSDNRAASDVTATTPVIIESAGPAEEVNMMTPPAISVVAAPEPAAEHSTPPAAEAEMAAPPVPATAVQPAYGRTGGGGSEADDATGHQRGGCTGTRYRTSHASCRRSRDGADARTGDRDTPSDGRGCPATGAGQSGVRRDAGGMVSFCCAGGSSAGCGCRSRHEHEATGVTVITATC